MKNEVMISETRLSALVRSKWSRISSNAGSAVSMLTAMRADRNAR